MKYKNPYLYDRDTIEHGWATKAEERAYNREYYQKHKEELLRKAREAREGIQRTAQNAYNTARREAQGIRDAVKPQPRQYSNPKGWKGGRDDTLWGLDKYVDGAHKERIDEARKYRNLAKNTPGAAETERRYRDAMRARSQQAAAVNEALKDGRQLAPDSRFDSKLVRDAQNAYSKVRGKGREAKREFDSAMTKARSAVEDAGRYLEKTYKDAQTRSQQRKQAKGYKLASDLLTIPDRIVNKMYPDRNELNEFYRNNPEARENRNKLNRYRRQYGTAANEAAKASMTRAQKEALKKREEAKRRMQKWFKR